MLVTSNGWANKGTDINDINVKMKTFWANPSMFHLHSQDKSNKTKKLQNHKKIKKWTKSFLASSQ